MLVANKFYYCVLKISLSTEVSISCGSFSVIVIQWEARLGWEACASVKDAFEEPDVVALPQKKGPEVCHI